MNACLFPFSFFMSSRHDCRRFQQNKLISLFTNSSFLSGQTNLKSVSTNVKLHIVSVIVVSGDRWHPPFAKGRTYRQNTGFFIPRATIIRRISSHIYENVKFDTLWSIFFMKARFTWYRSTSNKSREREAHLLSYTISSHSRCFDHFSALRTAEGLSRHSQWSFRSAPVTYLSEYRSQQSNIRSCQKEWFLSDNRRALYWQLVDPSGLIDKHRTTASFPVDVTRSASFAIESIVFFSSVHFEVFDEIKRLSIQIFSLCMSRFVLNRIESNNELKHCSNENAGFHVENLTKLQSFDSEEIGDFERNRSNDLWPFHTFDLLGWSDSLGFPLHSVSIPISLVTFSLFSSRKNALL